jgi:hypothetical protein
MQNHVLQAPLGCLLTPKVTVKVSTGRKLEVWAGPLVPFGESEASKG